MNQFRVLKVTALFVMLSAAFNSNTFANNPYQLPVKEGYFNTQVSQHSWTYEEAKKSINDWLRYPAQVEWSEIEHTKEIDGKFRVTLTPQVSGLEMSGNMVIMHFNKGVLHAINGNVGTLSKSLSTIPSISQQVAIKNAALQHGLTYALNNAKASLSLRNIEHENVLVWKVTINGFAQKDLKVKNLDVYVNARNGEVLHSVSKRSNANTQGSGDSYFYGNVDIDVMEEADQTFSLRDTVRNIYISNAGGQSMENGNGATVDDLFPNRRSIKSATSDFSKGIAVKEIILSDLPDSLSLDYGLSGMELFIPSVLVVESDGTNFDTISVSMSLDISFNSLLPLSFPASNKELYVPIDDSKTYQIGVQRLKINLLNGSEEVQAAIFAPMTLLTTGLHEINPNPEINIKYNIQKAENLGVDAMYAMQNVHDYYENKFQRNGFDGAGNQLDVLVDGVYSMGLTQLNAFALMEADLIAFGVGDGEYMNPFSNLDVMAHEYQHLVTQNNGRGGLEYSKEPGALNEAWSDIFAKAIEFEVHPTSASWKLGEELSLLPGGYMRNLEHPKNPNNALSFMMPSQPDTYKGQYWFNTSSQDDNGGVHYNSGVANKWFYLLVEGGTGTNDNNDAYDVEAIGMEKAIELAYVALMDKFTTTTNYAQAADLTMTVAEELYGVDSDEYQSVYDAWYAVGVFSSGISIDEQEAIASHYKVYPNPAEDVLHIENSSNEEVQVEIWNVSGQSVYSVKLMPGKQSLPLIGMQKGLYFIAFNKNGQKSVEKLVIK